MTERTFLSWLKKCGKKWKPFVEGGDIRLCVGQDTLCPLEAVQALKLGVPPDQCHFSTAACDLDMPEAGVVSAADNVSSEYDPAFRAKMLKALGLKEAKA